MCVGRKVFHVKNTPQGFPGGADIENGLEDMGRGKGKLGRSERVAVTYIHHPM